MFRLLTMIVLAAIIPVCAALIYKLFYNRHLNTLLAAAGSEGEAAAHRGKRWISPLAVGLITFAAEAIIVAGLFGLFMANRQSSIVEFDTLNNRSETYTAEQIQDTPYSSFDGGLVNGYSLEEKTQGDFRYYLYQNNGEVDDILPDYVLLFEYTGKEKVGSAYGLITFAGEGGAAGTGIILEPSDRYCAVIDMDNVNIYDVDKDTGEKRPMSEEDYNYEYSKAIYELRLYPFSPDNAPDTDVDEAEAIAEITIEFDR